MAKEKAMALKKHVIDKVGEAGELLIRAAAVLGTLSHEERDALDEATDGQLTGCIGLALNAAKDVSADLEESLITHPPAGFWKYQTDGR